MPSDERLSQIRQRLHDFVRTHHLNLNDFDQVVSDVRADVSSDDRQRAELANSDSTDVWATTDSPSTSSSEATVDVDATTALPAQFGAGQRVDPRLPDYELIDSIACGGMGVVYKARQKSLNRVVALKMILAGQLASEDQVQRFLSEAEAAANLDHPGIVPIYETGVHEGQHFFSMAFIEGQSLADKLNDGPLPAADAAALTVKIAEAVAYAHGQGVLHRDLKCANILLDTNGEPRVTDFGLAKRMEADRGLTVTGQIMGTPAFMPPEQAAGKLVDVRSDVYSLGAILYALLTGRPPHQAANPVDTIRAVIEREPAPPRQLDRSIPRDLETICLKALDKAPDRRYQTATALTEDLRRFQDDKPILARRVGRLQKSWLWAKRNPRVVSVAATAAALLLAGAALAYEWRAQAEADALVNGLGQADPNGVMEIVNDLSHYSRWSQASLVAMTTADAAGPTDHRPLHARMALVERDSTHIEPLMNALLEGNLLYLGPISRSLRPHWKEVEGRLWRVFHDQSEPTPRRFRAGLALAFWEPKSDNWAKTDYPFLSKQLLEANSVYQPKLWSYLKHIKLDLLPTLEQAFTQTELPGSQQAAAANAIAAFIPEQSAKLAQLIVQANPEQYNILFPFINESDTATQQQLQGLVSQRPQAGLSETDRLTLGKLRAGAAITRLRQGERASMFDALRIVDDIESLTQFVHRSHERKVTLEELVECLDEAEAKRRTRTGDARKIEDRVIYGLLLAMGDYELPDGDAEEPHDQ